jgi:hypothetical protein
MLKIFTLIKLLARFYKYYLIFRGVARQFQSGRNMTSRAVKPNIPAGQAGR